MKSKQNFISGTYVSQSDLGKVRLTNEDRTLCLTNSKGNVLLVVCDGMGGQNKGEYASTLGVKIFEEEFNKKSGFLNSFTAKKWIHKVCRLANEAIYDESCSNEKYKGMGTTLTACLLLPNLLIICQIGDSRAYVLRNKQMHQLTEDQTLVDYLYKTGKIKKEEIDTHPKRHVLMNALGIFPSVNCEITTYPYTNETILLCTDGLFNNVKEKDICNILKHDDSLIRKCNELISLANANGGSDNIAIILWEANK